jgi:hypothetical protein
MSSGPSLEVLVSTTGLLGFWCASLKEEKRRGVLEEKLLSSGQVPVV